MPETHLGSAELIIMKEGGSDAGKGRRQRTLPSACYHRATGGQSCKETMKWYTPDSVIYVQPSHLPYREGGGEGVRRGEVGIFTHQLQ